MNWSRKLSGLGVESTDPGLIAGYDLVPNGNSVLDYSGYNNDGTVMCMWFDYDAFGGGVRTPNRDCYINVPDSPSLNVSNYLTISIWASAKQLNHTSGGNNPRIIEKASSYLAVASQNGELRFYTYGLDPQSLAYSSIDINKLYHIVFMLDLPSNYRAIYLNGEMVAEDNPTGNLNQNANPLRIGGSIIANRSWYGKLYYAKIFDSVKNPSWIKTEYLKGLKAHFRTGNSVFEVSGVTNGSLGRGPFSVISGSFSVLESEGVKYIECISPGKFYLPAGFFGLDHFQSSYGDFEWHWSQGSAGNTTRLDFVSTALNNPDGYGLYIGSSGQLGLNEIGVGDLFTTDTGYCPAGIIHKQRVNRKYGGVFTSYTNDVQTIVSSGTNPVTDNTTQESLFVVGDFDAGDRLYLGDSKGRMALKKRVLP